MFKEAKIVTQFYQLYSRTICQLFQLFLQARHRHQPRHLLRNNSVDLRHPMRERRGGAAAPIQEGPRRKLPGTYQHDFYFYDRFTVDTQYFLMMEPNIALFCGLCPENLSSRLQRDTVIF